LNSDMNQLASLVTTRAADDEAFRARLLSAPRAAIEDLLGRSLPEDLEIHVHQETPGQLHLVLPAGAARSEAIPDGELGLSGGIPVYFDSTDRDAPAGSRP